MSKNTKAFNKLIEDAQKAALELYIKEAQEVLKKCKSLSVFVDAMGQHFFIDKEGDYPETEQLPKVARVFIQGISQGYFDTFRSVGMKVTAENYTFDW